MCGRFSNTKDLSELATAINISSRYGWIERLWDGLKI